MTLRKYHSIILYSNKHVFDQLYLVFRSLESTNDCSCKLNGIYTRLLFLYPIGKFWQVGLYGIDRVNTLLLVNILILLWFSFVVSNVLFFI